MRDKSQCVLCRKPIVAEFKPFCSRGCRDRDLLSWLGEEYRTAGPAAEDMDGEGGVRPALQGDD